MRGWILKLLLTASVTSACGPDCQEKIACGRWYATVLFEPPVQGDNIDVSVTGSVVFRGYGQMHCSIERGVLAYENIYDGCDYGRALGDETTGALLGVEWEITSEGDAQLVVSSDGRTVVDTTVPVRFREGGSNCRACCPCRVGPTLTVEAQ